MQQRCKMCDQPDKFDFHVPDEVWEAVVPEEFQTMVVCLYCFDEEAAKRGVNYAEAISEFCFAGRAVALGLKVTRWGDGKRSVPLLALPILFFVQALVAEFSRSGLGAS